MHPVFGENRGVLASPEVIVAPPAVILHPSRFDPSHLDGVDQFGNLFFLNKRRDEAALMFWSVGHRVDHDVSTEELHLRLRGRSQLAYRNRQYHLPRWDIVSCAYLVLVEVHVTKLSPLQTVH